MGADRTLHGPESEGRPRPSPVHMKDETLPIKKTRLNQIRRHILGKLQENLSQGHKEDRLRLGLLVYH